MSSKISGIYDDLHSRMATLFPTHNELVNPYFPEDESNLTIKKGWGLTLLEGDNLKKEIRRLTMGRKIEFLLTRANLTADLKLSGAMSKRKQAEKDLLEDQFTLLNFLQTDTYLKSSDFNNASKVQFVSDDGLNFVRGKQDHGIIILRSILEIEYFETVN